MQKKRLLYTVKLKNSIFFSFFCQHQSLCTKAVPFTDKKICTIKKYKGKTVVQWVAPGSPD